MTAAPAGRRGVRSYVLRRGRMTPAQHAAYARLYAAYGLEPAAARPPDWARIFPGMDLKLDVGFGGGESLLHYARAEPAAALVGFEVYRRGLAACLAAIEEAGIANVRVAAGDAAELMPAWFAPGSLAAVRTFFPDPWPKQRHRKRRLVNASFLALARDLLRPGGLLHMATDCEDYAREAAAQARATPGLALEHCGRGPPVLAAPRPPTRYELKGRRLGRAAWDVLARRAAAPAS